MSRTARQRSVIRVWLRILLGLAIPLLAAAPAADSKRAEEAGGGEVLQLVSRGTWAAIAVDDGRVVVLDVASGARFEWPSPEGDVERLAFAFPGDQAAGSESEAGDELPRILLVTSLDDSRSSLLLSVDAARGTPLHRVMLERRPEFLLGGPGGDVGFLLSGPGPRGDLWTLEAVNLANGSRERVDLSGPALGAALSPRGDRIYVALQNRIRTFSADPLRSSWEVPSPGNNRVVAPYLNGRFLVLRDDQVALFDPENIPARDSVTGLFPGDAALTKLDLPFTGQTISFSFDGEDVAVLDAGGRRLALVDVAGERIREARDLPGVSAVIFHPDRPSLFLFESSGNLSEIRFSPSRSRPVPREVTSAPRPAPEESRTREPVHAPTEADARPADTPPRGTGRDAEEAGAGPVDAPPVPGMDAGPPVEPPGAGDAAHPVESPAGPAGTLSGKITGRAELVEAVVLYGPNSIFREYSRVEPEADGSFSFPLPPEGSYRLLLVGAGGAQLNRTPPFRQFTVASEGVHGLDFVVHGSIEGRVRP